jgi:hypothetical protein
MRGVSLRYETVREWCLKVGQTYATVYAASLLVLTTVGILTNYFAESNSRKYPSIAFCHWGDADAGGLRILAHLRNSTKCEIKPLALDPATIKHRRTCTQPLT